MADLDAALAINPNHTRARLSRAACHVTADTPASLHAAADDYARAIELQPDAATCCQRAEVLVKLDRLPEAVKDLTRALVLAPGHAPALRARAGALASLGNEEAAADDWALLAEADDDAEVLLTAANALRGQGRWAEAQRACERSDAVFVCRFYMACTWLCTWLCT